MEAGIASVSSLEIDISSRFDKGFDQFRLTLLNGKHQGGAGIVLKFQTVNISTVFGHDGDRNRQIHPDRCPEGRLSILIRMVVICSSIKESPDQFNLYRIFLQGL